MLLKLGFARQWIEWMMFCVSFIDFRVLVNDQLIGLIFPGRGLRQGDPLSPYLYVLCAEGLTALFKDAERSGQLHGCKVCKGAPSVSHLLFTDDSILFFQSSITEARRVEEILNIYEVASGQAINYSKSGIVFSSNVVDVLQDAISFILEVWGSLDMNRYLGMPSLIGRRKKAVFSYLKDRLWKKIQAWSKTCFSKSGKEVLVKSVVQALPTYMMSVFLLPTSLMEELERMMNSF